MSRTPPTLTEAGLSCHEQRINGLSERLQSHERRLAALEKASTPQPAAPTAEEAMRALGSLVCDFSHADYGPSCAILRAFIEAHDG